MLMMLQLWKEVAVFSYTGVVSAMPGMNSLNIQNFYIKNNTMCSLERGFLLEQLNLQTLKVCETFRFWAILSYPGEQRDPGT